MSDELGTSVKGKRSENIVINKLLGRRYKVYVPTVDTGIDCIVDVGEKGRPIYKEIQVKYRQDHPTFNIRKLKPTDSFYVVCHLTKRDGDEFWIIPSKDFAMRGTRSKDSVQLRIGREGSDSYQGLASYHDNWGILLRGASRKVKKTMQKVPRRAAHPHIQYVPWMPEIFRPQTGAVSVDFTLPIVGHGALTGQTFTLSSTRGHVIVLEFMEPWAPHCQNMAPVLRDLYTKYQNDANVVFISVAGPWNGPDGKPTSANDAANFIGKYGAMSICVYDSLGTVFSSWGINAVPAFYVIERSGRISSTFTGEQSAYTLASAISTAQNR